MKNRRPRKRYDGDDYPRYGEGPSRRSVLRRIGGLGGLVLMGSGPWVAALTARADYEGWVAHVPENLGWRSFFHGDQPVYYRVVVEVTRADIADCIADLEMGIIEEIDAYLLTLELADIESEVARPEIEDRVVAIVAAACPAPGFLYDDDSADDDDDPADDDVSSDHTLVRLDLQLTEPEDEWDVMGIMAEPSCACRLPKP